MPGITIPNQLPHLPHILETAIKKIAKNEKQHIIPDTPCRCPFGQPEIEIERRRIWLKATEKVTQSSTTT